MPAEGEREEEGDGVAGGIGNCCDGLLGGELGVANPMTSGSFDGGFEGLTTATVTAVLP